MCVLHQEILEIECARAKTQHKRQKFTRACVVKSDMISPESLAGKIDHSKYIKSSGVHCKVTIVWDRNAFEGLKWLLSTSCFSYKSLE